MSTDSSSDRGLVSIIHTMYTKYSWNTHLSLQSSMGRSTGFKKSH
jgi:hypothetical protein